MYLSAISVMIGLTALYFGSILLMEVYSQGSNVSKDGLKKEKLSYLERSNPSRGWM